MTRQQLEHVIRAAAAITGDNEIVVIGSTSILGQFPDAPAEMLGSIEADVYPRNHPERFELIDVTGEMSAFRRPSATTRIPSNTICRSSRPRGRIG